MHHNTYCIAFTLILGFCLGSARAQTSYPMITHAAPVAVQRGKTAQVIVQGQMDFTGVYKAIFDEEEFQAEVAPAEIKSRRGVARGVQMKLSISPKAKLGVHEFRLASNRGISSVGQLLVVDLPVVEESGDNNTPEKANSVKLPAVITGRIEAVEDVDFFRFHAEAGQILTFEVYCARLQDKIHDLQKHADPLLTLYDSKGRELAGNDDFYFADPYLTYKVTQTGDYLLQVRDAKYDGDPRWVYAVVATTQPCVSHVFPIAGKPGQKREVELVGSASHLQPRATISMPSEPGIHQIALDVAGKKTPPVTVISSNLPQVTEIEPNDTPAQATRFTIPAGINGRIGVKRDLDYYRFAATKGKPIRFEIKARRFGTPLYSSLDSFLDIMDSKGAVLASNDDSNGKDAALVFNPPADGEYLVRVRDLNNQGGPTAVYYLEVDWAKPDFALRCDSDKAMIGPGSSTAWYVQVTRLNGFAGPVQIEVENLPRGVSVNPLTITPSMTQGALVLTAAADAPRDAKNIRVIGRAELPLDGKAVTARRVAAPIEEIYLPGGGRGRFEVGMHTVAVTDPSDILHVNVSPANIVLHPGQEVRLDVTLERRSDYTKDVSLDILLQHLGGVHGNPLPPGVTIVEGKSKTLLGSGNKGHIVLRADPSASPIEQVPICVLAHVSINFVVKISYSSPPLWLSIRK